MTDEQLPAVAEPRHPAPLVGANAFQLMAHQAKELSKSGIIPKDYRGRPANILAAWLMGREYGWDAMQAMRHGNVIEGKWDLSPEAALGMVRRAGHSVQAEESDVAAGPEGRGWYVTGTRKDNGDTLTVSYLVQDAIRANLVRLKDGKPYARSSTNKPLPWETYTSDMCYWRAVGRLCRYLFSDVTGGDVYAPAEFTHVDDDGVLIEDVGPIDHAPAQAAPLSDDALEKFRETCEGKNKLGVVLDSVQVLKRAFPDGVPEPLTEAHLPHMRDTFLAMMHEEAGDLEDDSTTEDEGAGEPVEDAPVPSDEVRPATRNQVGQVKAEYARLGIDDREKQLDETETILSVGVSSHNDLNRDQAAELIDALTKMEPVEEA